MKYLSPSDAYLIASLIYFQAVSMVKIFSMGMREITCVYLDRQCFSYTTGHIGIQIGKQCQNSLIAFNGSLGTKKYPTRNFEKMF